MQCPYVQDLSATSGNPSTGYRHSKSYVRGKPRPFERLGESLREQVSELLFGFYRTNFMLRMLHAWVFRIESLVEELHRNVVGPLHVTQRRILSNLDYLQASRVVLIECKDGTSI